MAILDLSSVTKAMRLLILESIKTSPVWSPRSDPDISVLPPDKLKKESMGIYLYHVVEDPHFKNQPDRGGGPVPVSYTPMALNLYYLITTDGQVDTDTLMYDAQLLIGLTVKTLHDNPVISDETEINGKEILKEVGLDNTDTRLRLHMQPVPHDDAVDYWTAGQSPLRLSAYYQVSVVMLEPEEPPVRAGRVLDYGITSFVSGAPRLMSSENRVEFTVPGTTESQEIVSRPATVPIGSRITFKGINLGSDDTRLVISNSAWDSPATADPGWSVTATNDTVYATVGEAIAGRDILPGIYSAKAEVNVTRTASSGASRLFSQTSNETPFTITPRIDSPVMTANASGEVSVAGYPFQHPDLTAGEDIEVFIGPDRLYVGTAGSLNPGEYAVVDATNLTLRLPAAAQPGFLPFRLIINGAESPPAWVELP